jgi:hypothetical protein
MVNLKKISNEINEILENKRKEIQLTFIEEGHEYTMLNRNGVLKTDFPSVSVVLEFFCNKFDSEGKSLQMCNGDKEKQKVLLESWEQTAIYASNKGSRVHYELEKYILEKNKIKKEVRVPIFEIDKQQKIDSDNMIIAGKKFLDLMEDRGCVLIDTEIILGSPNLGYVGQADNFWLSLNKNKNDILFIVTDHKTNKVKNLTPQPYNGFLKPPFQSEIDYALTHYYLQLPLYGKLFLDMLKGSKYENIKFGGCIIDSLRDSGTFKEYRVPQIFIDELLKMDLKKYIES